MDSSIRFPQPARTTNDFNIGRVAGAAAAQGAAAAAAAGAAAGAAAAKPIADGLTLSGAAAPVQANLFAPAPAAAKNNAAADTITDGLKGIKNLGEAVAKAMVEAAGISDFIKAAR
jgi:hypothetical protein